MQHYKHFQLLFFLCHKIIKYRKNNFFFKEKDNGMPNECPYNRFSLQKPCTLKLMVILNRPMFSCFFKLFCICFLMLNSPVMFINVIHILKLLTLNDSSFINAIKPNESMQGFINLFFNPDLFCHIFLLQSQWNNCVQLFRFLFILFIDIFSEIFGVLQKFYLVLHIIR